MNLLLSNFSMEYLQNKYKETRFLDKEIIINQKTLHSTFIEKICTDEEFKEHPFIDIFVSNYGRIKKDQSILEQKLLKKGYLYINYPILLNDLQLQFTNDRKKYRTPVAYGAIEQDTNLKNQKFKEFSEHPFIDICKYDNDKYFSIDWNYEKIFYNLKKATIENENMINIPIYIYRLVAETWIENPDSSIYTIVHHIENNGYNNVKENLMWVTKEQHDYIEGRVRG